MCIYSIYCMKKFSPHAEGKLMHFKIVLAVQYRVFLTFLHYYDHFV